MLVLSRKKGQTIDIAGGAKDGGVTITVLSIGGSVRIGTEAHRDVSIVRGELRKRDEMKQSVSSNEE